MRFTGSYLKSTPLLLMTVLLMLGAACGDGGGNGDTPAESPTQPAETSAEQQTEQDTSSAEWDAVVDEARAEGRVVFYTNLIPATAERLVNAFQEEYPEIEVQFDRALAGELITRMDQERSTGASGADVTIHSGSAWFVEQAEEGNLAELQGPDGTDWPAEWLLEGQEQVPVMGLSVFGIGVNTDLVDQVPAPSEAYETLLDPQYEGRVGIPDVQSSPAVGVYDWLEETQIDDFMAKLAEQDPRIYNGSNPIAQALAAGEVALNSYALKAGLADLVEAGAPVEFIAPNPAIGLGFYGAVLDWAERPNAAQVLLNWLMTPEAQSLAWSDGEGASPIGAEGTEDISEVEHMDLTKYTPDVMAQFQERFEELFR